MPSSSLSTTSDLSFDPSGLLSAITQKKISGRKKFRETRHPIYRGVRERKGAKWVCEMRLNNSNIIKSRLWLGTHISAEMAARAYDIAAMALKGNSAQLNFPDSAWLLIRAISSSEKDIQSAALVAAHAFRPIVLNSSSTCIILPRVQSLKTLLETTSATLEVVKVFLPIVDTSSTSTSTCIILPCVETLKTLIQTSPPKFLDEEAMFNMPSLLANMAEGMLLTPPPCIQHQSNWDNMYIDSIIDVSLWSY